MQLFIPLNSMFSSVKFKKFDYVGLAKSVGCNADERLLPGMDVAVRISIAVYNYSNKLVRRDTGCLRRTKMTARTSRQANYSLSGMRWLVRRKGHGTTNHALRALLSSTNKHIRQLCHVVCHPIKQPTCSTLLAFTTIFRCHWLRHAPQQNADKIIIELQQ